MKRRIVFYQWGSLDGFPEFDRQRAAETVGAMPDDSDRPVSHGDFAIDVEVSSRGSELSPTRLTLMRLRSYQERPWARAPGEPAAPTSMRPEQDMLDFSHVVLWPDGIAAFTMGGHSPAPSALATFMLHRANEHLALTSLYQPDVVQKLRSWKGVRSVNLRVRNSPHTQEQLNSTRGAFGGLVKELMGQEDEVVVRAEVAVPGRGPGSRSRILRFPVDDVIDLAGRAEVFDTLQVAGVTKTGRIERLDLTKERLQVEVSLPRAAAGGHRTDEAATFSAMDGAYTRLAADGSLKRAAKSVAD